MKKPKYKIVGGYSDRHRIYKTWTIISWQYHIIATCPSKYLAKKVLKALIALDKE